MSCARGSVTTTTWPWHATSPAWQRWRQWTARTTHNRKREHPHPLLHLLTPEIGATSQPHDNDGQCHSSWQVPTSTTYNHECEHSSPPTAFFNIRTRCHIADGDVATKQRWWMSSFFLMPTCILQEPTPTTHNHHSEHLQPPSPSLIFNTRTRCHVTDSNVATTWPLHFVKPEPPNDVFHLGLTQCEEYEMGDDRQQHASAALSPCPPLFTFV